MLAIQPIEKKGGAVDNAAPPPRYGSPGSGESWAKVDRFTKPAEAGFFVGEDSGGVACATPWDLIGRARRLTSTLLDLIAYIERVDEKECRAVLEATQGRVAEARRVREELLAQGERIGVATLTTALMQFPFATAN